jgi:alkylhydroperoxidase family enzyme
MSPDQLEMLAPVAARTPHQNHSRTLLRNPPLYKSWSQFALHLLNGTDLDARDRELLILRTGWVCRAEYEWAKHILAEKAAGVTDAEIARVKTGSGSLGWSSKDRQLMITVDALHQRFGLSLEEWSALSLYFPEPQLMEIVFVVGQYHLVAMAFNSFGVQLETGMEGF